MENKEKFELTDADANRIRSKFFDDEDDRSWEYTLPTIKEQLSFLKRLFIASKFQVGLKLDCYGYWPTNEELTKWVASDGSRMDRSLVDILVDYGSDLPMQDYLLMEPEGLEEDLCIPKRMRQAEFEDTYM